MRLYVVLFDPWCNPVVEAQVIDRSHGTGQDRTVSPTDCWRAAPSRRRFWELHQRKAALSRALLGEDSFARALDREALAYLLEEDLIVAAAGAGLTSDYRGPAGARAAASMARNAA